MKRHPIELVITASLALSAAASALAQSSEPAIDPGADEGWRFKLAPYFWLGAMDGSVSKGPVTANVNQDLGDVVDLLSDHFNGGLALHFEAAHDRWGILADGMYLNLRAEGTGANTGVKVDTEFKQFTGELGGFYSVVRPGSYPAPPWVPSLDILGGMRVYSMDSSLALASGATAERNQAWVDPIIGIRGEIRPLDWLAVFGRTDIGGFGLDKGTFSNFSWNVEAGLRFDFSRTVGLSLGYRWLDVDYENPDANFIYDIRTSGPFTALEFRF